MMCVCVCVCVCSCVCVYTRVRVSICMYAHTRTSIYDTPSGDMAKVLDCCFKVSEFEHQSRRYIHFQIPQLLCVYKDYFGIK